MVRRLRSLGKEGVRKGMAGCSEETKELGQDDKDICFKDWN